MFQSMYLKVHVVDQWSNIVIHLILVVHSTKHKNQAINKIFSQKIHVNLLNNFGIHIDQTDKREHFEKGNKRGSKNEEKCHHNYIISIKLLKIWTLLRYHNLFRRQCFHKIWKAHVKYIISTSSISYLLTCFIILSFLLLLHFRFTLTESYQPSVARYSTAVWLHTTYICKTSSIYHTHDSFRDRIQDLQVLQRTPNH